MHRIKLILNEIDINKAQGPDAINGAVLKNCAVTLAYPLSKMFNLIYNVGYIPVVYKTISRHPRDNQLLTQKIELEFTRFARKF